MTESTFDALVSILDEEVIIHSELVEIARKMNTAIRTDELDHLQEHTSQYDQLFCRLEKLEILRVNCCARLSGVSSPQKRFNSLVGQTPEPLRSRLTSLHTALKQKIAELTTINTSNRILLEEALGVITGTVNKVRQTVTKYTPYRHTGSIGRPARVPTLINRTV